MKEARASASAAASDTVSNALLQPAKIPAAMSNAAVKAAALPRKDFNIFYKPPLVFVL